MNDAQFICFKTNFWSVVHHCDQESWSTGSIHPHRTGIPWAHNPMWSRLRERSPLLFYSYSEQMNVTHIAQTVKTDFMHEDGNEANVAMKRGRAVLTCCTHVAINMDKFHHPFLLPLLAPKEYRVTLKSLIINRIFFLKMVET